MIWRREAADRPVESSEEDTEADDALRDIETARGGTLCRNLLSRLRKIPPGSSASDNSSESPSKPAVGASDAGDTNRVMIVLYL